MAQEPLHMPRPQIARMPLVKVFDVAFNPIDVRLLSADRVMQHPQPRAHLIKQARLLHAAVKIGGRGDVGDGIHGFSDAEIIMYKYTVHKIKRLCKPCVGLVVARDAFPRAVRRPN